MDGVTCTLRAQRCKLRCLCRAKCLTRSLWPTDARSLPGVCPPLGFWDPLGFAVTTTNEVKRMREAELVHGRVAMLAAVGWLVAERWHPLFGGSIEGASARCRQARGGGRALTPGAFLAGPALTHFQQLPSPFWLILVESIGIAEAARARIGWVEPSHHSWFKLRASYTPGDLGFDPLQLLPLEPAGVRDMKTRELNNGRLGAQRGACLCTARRKWRADVPACNPRSDGGGDAAGAGRGDYTRESH